MIFLFFCKFLFGIFNFQKGRAHSCSALARGMCTLPHTRLFLMATAYIHNCHKRHVRICIQALKKRELTFLFCFAELQNGNSVEGEGTWRHWTRNDRQFRGIIISHTMLVEEILWIPKHAGGEKILKLVDQLLESGRTCVHDGWLDFDHRCGGHLLYYITFSSRRCS